jgi:hypothetical protein
LSKFIFNRIYIDSVLNIFKEITILEDSDYTKAREADLQSLEGGQFEMFKFLTTFFLTTVIRAKERKSVPSFMKIIREALNKNVGLSIWLLETFGNQDLIKELTIDCPIPDMKRFVAGLLRTAMQIVYKFEEKQIYDYCLSLDTDPIDYIQKTQAQHIKQYRVIDSKQIMTKREPINSQCTELSIFSMKHHSAELPVLILFINSFIH